MAELINTCETCAGDRMPLSIFSPANCRKMPELRMITGGGTAGRSVLLEIDDCPGITLDIPDCGRFETRNPYLLDKGYHTVRVSYKDCECGNQATVWVYIQPVTLPNRPAANLTDNSDSRRISDKQDFRQLADTQDSRLVFDEPDTGLMFDSPDSRRISDMRQFVPAERFSENSENFNIELTGAVPANRNGYVKLSFVSRGYSGKLELSYLLLSAGSPPPTISEIMHFSDVSKLVDGTAARGIFSRMVDENGTEFERAIAGCEANSLLEDELGLVPGHSYDVYVCAVAGDRNSGILKSGSPVTAALLLPNELPSAYELSPSIELPLNPEHDFDLESPQNDDQDSDTQV